MTLLDNGRKVPHPRTGEGRGTEEAGGAKALGGQGTLAKTNAALFLKTPVCGCVQILLGLETGPAGVLVWVCMQTGRSSKLHFKKKEDLKAMEPKRERTKSS